jgi:hypothetical protein
LSLYRGGPLRSREKYDSEEPKSIIKAAATSAILALTVSKSFSTTSCVFNCMIEDRAASIPRSGNANTILAS